MPRIQSPIRNRPIIIPKQVPTFNYTFLITLAIALCSVLFCDTLRYLIFIIVLLGLYLLLWYKSSSSSN